MTRTALAFSPHLDDAAFSCGGTLATLAQAGWRVVVATLFTRSVPDPQGFGLACQLDKGLGPEVDYMALRRAEDEAAMLALGVAAPVHVRLAEAPHRGYASVEALFGRPRPDDTIEADLRGVMAGLVEEQAPDLVLGPQAIGAHVDHVQVARVLLGLDRPVLWWRDFPYAVRSAGPPEPFRDRIGALPERSVGFGPEAMARREAACLAYASQIGFQFGSPDGLRASLALAGTIDRFRAARPLEL